MKLWDDSEAAVVCGQLGYTYTGEVLDCNNNNSIKIIIMTIQFTGDACVSHDNTWMGGFVSVNCMNGMESSLEDCDPVKVITSREDTCKRGNQARLLCEPGMNFQK